MDAGDQQEKWESFYRDNRRPWRGVGPLGPFKPTKDMNVLDLGCGNGKTSAALIGCNAKVTGIDFSETAVESCRNQFGDGGKFLTADCTELPFDDESFDAVTAVHILEHLDLEQLAHTVSEIRRVLVPGGFVFVRCFAVGDMRSEGKDESVRNGIRYRYYDIPEMERTFDGFETVSAERLDESTRFGTVRVRLEILFRRPRD